MPIESNENNIQVNGFQDLMTDELMNLPRDKWLEIAMKVKGIPHFKRTLSRVKYNL